MESEDEIIRYYEDLKAQGKELDNLVPVKATISPSAGIVFSVRFTGDEFREIEERAKAKGMKVSAFIRTAALAATRDEIDLQAGEHASAIQEVQAKVRELADKVSRL